MKIPWRALIIGAALWGLILGIVLCAQTGGAAQVQVRANDAGIVSQVPVALCSRLLDFSPDQWNHRGRSTDEHDGLRWGAKLWGLEEECLDAPRNTCHFLGELFGDPECTDPTGALRGSGPDGVVRPTVPVRAALFGADLLGKGAARTYISDFRGGFALVSYLGCGSWGDGPIALSAVPPVASLCLDLIFNKSLARNVCEVGERLHVEFWGPTGEHLGHQDIVEGGEPMAEGCRQSFCWESGRPLAAVTTWTENGPGSWWDAVCVPEPDIALLSFGSLLATAAIRRSQGDTQ